MAGIGSPEHLLAHTIWGAAVSAATGNDVLTGGVSAGVAEGAAPILSDYLYDTTDPSELTTEQKETISNITSLAGIAIGATTGDVSNAVNSSQVATNAAENNYLRHNMIFSLAEKITAANGNLEEMERLLSNAIATSDTQYRMLERNNTIYVSDRWKVENGETVRDRSGIAIIRSSELKSFLDSLNIPSSLQYLVDDLVEAQQHAIDYQENQPFYNRPNVELILPYSPGYGDVPTSYGLTRETYPILRERDHRRTEVALLLGVSILALVTKVGTEGFSAVNQATGGAGTPQDDIDTLVGVSAVISNTASSGIVARAVTPTVVVPRNPVNSTAINRNVSRSTNTARLPSTREQLRVDLESQGFYSTGRISAGGYEVLRKLDPSGQIIVTIKPTGEVIRSQNVWNSERTRKIPERQNYFGNRLEDQSHSTGHFVE